MIEALWSVAFLTEVGTYGAGVVVLESGRIFGGDSNYYYVGSYEIARGCLHCEVEAQHYAGQVNNVFGDYRTVTLKLSGEISENGFTISGLGVEPNVNATVQLTRRAELPQGVN